MSEITVLPGEIQGTIDEQKPSNPDGFMNDERTKITLSGDPAHEFSSDTDPLPITLGAGVTLDMNGRDFIVREDGDVFVGDQNAWVLDGRIDYTAPGTSYSSSVWDFDTTRSGVFESGGGNSGGGLIRNVHTVGAAGNDGYVYDLLADESPVAGWVFEGCTHHNPGSSWLYGEINDGTNWINGNFWNNTAVYGGEIQIEWNALKDGNTASERTPIRGNHISGGFEPNESTRWHCSAVGGLIGNQHVDLHTFPNPGGYDDGIVQLDVRTSGDRVSRNMWLDHTNTPHPNNSYGHNVGFFEDSTGQSNAFTSWMWDGLMYGSTL